MLQTRRQAQLLLRSYQRSVICRLNSTDASENSISSSQPSPDIIIPPPPTPTKRTPRKPTEEDADSLSAFIYPRTRLRSMVDAYAVIRAVEQRYGPVREFHFTPDRDVPVAYQKNVYVVFHSSESRARIKPNGELVTIFAPDHDYHKPGGISLNDLEKVLRPGKFGEIPEIPAFDEVLGDTVDKPERSPPYELKFDINPARNNFFQTPSSSNARLTPLAHRYQLSQNLMKWGGFYQPPPVDPDAQPSGEKSKRPLMDSLLASAENTIADFELSRPRASSATPSAASPSKQASLAEVPAEWEPLPLETSDEPIPVPNAVRDASPSTNQPAAASQSTSTPEPSKPQVETASSSSTPAKSLPTATKRAPRLSATSRPSLSQTSSYEAELLRQSGEQTLSSSSSYIERRKKQRGGAKVVEPSAAESKVKEPEAQEAKKEVNNAGLGQRFKKYLGGWF
ncbi:hypothetical protein HGRIS_002058 [Hohenbuehelia grisea]|uniref:Uncharacterized protein n=1 Tax=Hohenbuehelia grisea TaxID=104357 RepID=A0ABR3JL34_9AGAR